METCLQALKTVFRSRRYQLLGTASFALFLLLYLVTLPSAFTGGRVGFIALPFLTVELAIWSVVMAALIAIIATFIVFLVRQGMAVSKTSTVGGVIGGVVGPLLCCSPVLPITMSFVAGIFPVAKEKPARRSFAVGPSHQLHQRDQTLRLGAGRRGGHGAG